MAAASWPVDRPVLLPVAAAAAAAARKGNPDEEGNYKGVSVAGALLRFMVVF